MTPHEVSSNNRHTPNSGGTSLQSELDRGGADEDAGLGMDVAEVGLASGCENAEMDDASSDIE